MKLSYDVRFWAIRKDPRAKNRPFRLRWVVGGRPPFSEYFATYNLAESREAELKRAARRGEAFDLDSGLPVSEARARHVEATSVSWLSHATEYAQHKWPRIAGSSRVSIAEGLLDITLALLPKAGRARPDEKTLRRALKKWAFNGQNRDVIPDDITDAIKWAESTSPPLSDLSDLDTVRHVLDSFTKKLDGTNASATYLARRRQVFHNVLKYAVTKGRLETVPLNDPKLNWERPSELEVDHAVDPRAIGGTADVAAMLVAVSYVGRGQGPRFVAFFACMFYAMMRPEEVCGLRLQDCDLPAKGWGTLMLEATAPAPGRDWTDAGTVHDPRGLKRRPRKTVRPVPIPPELVHLLHQHIDQFGTATDGRIFRSVNDNPISPSTYSRVWKNARKFAMPPERAASVLLWRPYDLRHAGVSIRLYAGVPAKQVAEWAGHSVEVLQRVYSRVLDGFDDTWFARIDGVLGSPKPQQRPDHRRNPTRHVRRRPHGGRA